MKYNFFEEKMILQSEQEKDMFFRVFLNVLGNDAKLYRETFTDATMEDIKHNSVVCIATDKDGYVYCAEVWYEEGKYYAKATIRRYDLNRLTREEVAYICRDMRHYWTNSEEGEYIILCLAEMKPLNEIRTRKVVGYIFDNGLNVATDERIYDDLLPRMYKKMQSARYGIELLFVC